VRADKLNAKKEREEARKYKLREKKKRLAILKAKDSEKVKENKKTNALIKK